VIGGEAYDLIRAIQEGPLEEAPWSSFVTLLRSALNGNYANLIFRRPDLQRGDPLEVHDGNAPAWLGSRYRSEFLERDPIPYFRMIPGRVYTYEELDGISALTDDAFRKDFLRAAGFEHFLIFRVIEPGRCNIWVTVTRPASGASFSQDERALCAQLAKHLSPALACHAALLKADFEKCMYQRAANMLAFGVIMLDGAGQVISIDVAARRQLEQSDELIIAQDRLCAHFGDRELQDCIRDALAANDTRSCHVGDVSGLDLLIVPVERRLDAGIGTPRLLVYISGRGNSDRETSQHLARLFELSGAQARLAMLLVNGRTLSQAADAMGITEHTARTYSKQIFQRTGTTRQSELIQRILTSVAMLG